MRLQKLRLSFLVATIVAACMVMGSCQTDQKITGYSYKHSKNPKFIGDIAMGDHKRNGINLDDVVEDNDEEDTSEVATTNNSNTYAITAPPTSKKSNIKVQVEEAEPQGIKPPLSASFTDAVTTVAKTVTQTISSVQEKYAFMLGIMPSSICNTNLYQYIDEWYGVRYHFGGTSKNGIDCSAFVQQLYEHVFGTNLLRTAIEQFANTDFVKKATELKEGDLVFFHIHSRHITHVGIYLANNFFIHASRSQGVTISNLNDSYWRKYYAGASKMGKG